MAEIALTSARFGLGNQNFDHVHRHNTMNLGSMAMDQLKMEQYNGGMRSDTLTKLAEQAGGISVQPQGYVSVEDGWNVRRGLGLLKFVVSENVLVQQELAVLGYLTGAPVSADGIPSECVFVPVRAWSMLTQNVTGLDGFETTKAVMESSQQFLMGDPNLRNNLKSVRPIDVGNEAIGYMSAQAEKRENSYDGAAGTDLNSSGLVVSKTANLNPVHHSRELMRMALEAGVSSEYHSLEQGLAESLDAFGLGEVSISDNGFFQAMMFHTGHHAMKGFQGYSMGEINGCFVNLPEVLNIQHLQESNFAPGDTALMNSQAYGTASMHEIIATELAMLTVHMLINSGLTSFCFSATNNPMDFNGMMGSEDGVVVLPGEVMSVFDYDEHWENKIERFVNTLKSNFFAKYNSAYEHQRTIINVRVDSFMFGETTVEISLNGEHAQTQSFTNATYCINRTSTNISGRTAGLQQSSQYLNNIKEYFGTALGN